MLGRLRLDPQQISGRRFPEPAHPYRNDFQRDRDRVIHSRAFRRLEGKTQVFAAGLHDHFRNRLTHTIEVSQIARTIAVALQLNEEYTETLALVHDLGHPPFGHVGERELNRQMENFGDTFEHNRHALRIVDVLERRYARFDGLNLTNEVREGIVKHSRELPAEAESPFPELLPGKLPPLEAQLIDLADEIAYNTADIDDAFGAKILSIEEVSEAIPAFAELAEAVDTQFPGAPEHVRFWEIQRHVVNILVGGLIHGTAQAADEAGVETTNDVRDLPFRIAKFSRDAAEVNGPLRNLLVQRVYTYAELVEHRTAAVDKLRALFSHLVQNPDQLSLYYQERLAEEPVHRVVCDYLAGMTDAYLLRISRELLR